MHQAIEQSVAALVAPLVNSESEDYIGEEISQLEHALQAAYWAQKTQAPDEVILAALFHDIGHLIAPDAPQMDGLGVMDHETIGANFLVEHGCSTRMADLVAAHVGAKRYLCHRKPTYYNRLSEASKGTLEFQGGPMNEEEATAFESSPGGSGGSTATAGVVSPSALVGGVWLARSRTHVECASQMREATRRHRQGLGLER